MAAPLALSGVHRGWVVVAGGFGPTAPPQWWLNPAQLETSAPIPSWVQQFRPGGRRIRQIWNVIEGKQDGVALLIFDAVIGEYKGGQLCTVIARKTLSPLVAVTSAERVVQFHGWTLLHGVWFLWFSWTMGMKRISRHVGGLDRR